MRLVLMFVFILALAAAGYVAIGGFFLAKAATGLLQVGTIASAISMAPPPEDPLALGYRGTPVEALGLPFQTVRIETPLAPPKPGWSRPRVPSAGARSMSTESQGRARMATATCRCSTRPDGPSF